MAGKKKGSKIKILFILIIFTCVVIIAAFSWKKGRDTIHGDFESDKKAMAEVLYSDVSGTDIEKNYPKTPDEVMQFYGKCYKLIYGNMIKNEDILAETLHIQRKLFSDELASKNVFESQFEKIKEDVANLKESGVWVIDFETKPPMYDKEYNTCEVRTVISTNANGENGASLKVYMLFNIVKDENGFWKIHAFRNTNSDFEEL